MDETMMYATRKPWTSARTGALALLLVICSAGSAAAQFSIDVDCPATASVGQNVPASVTLESRECFATTARIITSIVGNSNDTFGGIGVFGPVVADPLVAIPAATDLFPPGCFSTIPGSTSFLLSVVPTLDASLTGTVVTVIFLAEFENGQTVQVDQCLVEVTP
jgi:hypothetical protein